jgi:preprotein translocase subunit SecG
MNIPTLQTLAAWDWSRFGIGLTVVVFGAICLLLVLAILIQKPQGGGLSGAFGAGASGSGQTAFGTKTGDALTWMTIIIFLVYLGAAIGMNYAMRPMDTTPSGGNASSVPTPADKVPVGDRPVPANTATPPATTPPADKPADKPPAATSTINVKPADAPATTPGAAPVTPAPVAPAPVAPAPIAPPPGNPAATPPASTPPATTPPVAPPK